MNKTFGLVFQGLFFINMIGCASYQSKVSEAKNLVQAGQYKEAAEKLKPLAENEDKDQLVYLLDYAMMLYLSGDYQQSVKYLIKADKIAEIQDYHSISNVASSLALNAEQIQYKGENYEKLFIDTYLALNFLNQNNIENAIVSARRINEKLYKMKYEGKKNYEQNEFAKYLAAALWESDKNWDNAYISYEEAYKINPGIPYIQEDLLRTAKKSDRQDAYQKWKSEFKSTKENPNWNNKTMGELIFIYEQGWIPEKVPNPDAPRFPTLRPVHSQIQSVKIKIGDQEKTSEMFYNVGQVAMKTMSEDYGALIATRLAGVATKAVLADQIRQKNELLGNVAWIVTNVMDRADLRQWSTLPNSYHIVRMWVPAGEYGVEVQGVGFGSSTPLETKVFEKIKIEAGKKRFLTWRTFR